VVLLIIFGTAAVQASSAISLTKVPEKGSFDDLVGKVTSADLAAYRVAVYIRVNGGWWTKPYWNHPTVQINEGGEWVCDITTGGVDETADAIIAFLVPKNYKPPLANNDAWFKTDFLKHTVARVSVKR